MTDKEYAADCIAFLRELAEHIRGYWEGKGYAPTAEHADKLDEIATSLQVDTQEEA